VAAFCHRSAAFVLMPREQGALPEEQGFDQTVAEIVHL